MASMEMPSRPELSNRIENLLNAQPNRPWCVHRLYEEVVTRQGPQDRRDLLRVTEQVADDLAAVGRVRRELVSAISIGVQCRDALYWSARSANERLEEFGPEYESPTILHRLASHFECHGL